MSMLLKSYSAKNHRLIVGAHAVVGVAEDFITVEPVGDGDQSESGAYGDVVRSVSHDSRFRITLTLQYGSASNAVLTALKEADQMSNGAATFPVMFTDLAGSVPICTGEGWIVNRPSSAYGAAAQNREWTIEFVGVYVPV